MGDIVEIVADIMRADLDQFRTIGNNLANANTTGFKREITTNTGFYDVLGGDSTRSILKGNVVPNLITESQRIFSQGAMKATQNSMDVAIEGDAAFVVNSNGEQLLTRRGDFAVDSVGRLALSSGELVQGISGEIFLGSEDFDINGEGQLLRDQKAFDQLRIVKFGQASENQYIGSGLFSASLDQDVAPEDYKIMQGFLESANVNPTYEMVHLIEVLRRFETGSTVLKAYDGMLEYTISELGRF